MMLRQLSIDRFFTKSKTGSLNGSGSVDTNMSDDKKPTKRRLSLKMPVTPVKCKKVSEADSSVPDVVVVSDDEDVMDSQKLDSTQTTIKSEDSIPNYIVAYMLTPGFPNRIPILATPVKSPHTPQTSGLISPPNPDISNTPGKAHPLSASTPQSTIENSNLQIKIETPVRRSSQASAAAVESSQSPQPPQIVQTPFKTSPSTTAAVTPPKSTQIPSSTSQSQPLNLNTLQTVNKTPVKTPQSLRSPSKTLQTPNGQDTPQKPSPSTSSTSNSSPRSTKTFYSPTKKRVKRIPVKVKRSLSTEFSQSNQGEDEVFAAACKGYDDKTMFLLRMINDYLKDPTLRDLLDTSSQELLTKCLNVVKPSMKLVCRLYWRKEGWYKLEEISKICSEDKKPLDEEILGIMIQSLVESGLVLAGDVKTMSFTDFTTVLNRPELQQICKDLKLKIASKQDAIEALSDFSHRKENISQYFTGYTSNNAERVLQIMSAKAGHCFKLSDFARTTLYKLYILMYLGMDYTIIREKHLEYVLLTEKVKRETFPVDKTMQLDNASVVFANRDEFERYLSAHNIYEDFLNKTDVAEKCATVRYVYDLYQGIDQQEMMRYASLPTWLRRYTPAYKYIKILENGIQDLKRDKTGGHYLLSLNILSTLIAQNVFRQHKKANWYAEKALILHSLLQRYDEAAEVLIECFESNISDELKDGVRQRARKIAYQKNAHLTSHLKERLSEHAIKTDLLESSFPSEHFYKQPMDRTGNKRGKVKFETRTSEGRSIQDAEQYCIEQYVTTYKFTEGEHWEGRIVTTIFYLLFWDIIYSKPEGVRGIFLSYFQRFPLDLYSESFYANRREAIDRWLAIIEGATEDKLLKIMHDTWNKRPEGEQSGICRELGWDKIEMVASCLGPRGLAAICRRLATNYAYAHSGFPDLTLWNRQTKQIKFVEVKTDTDKPSQKQLQWMHYLQENGIDTEFCYVGANTTRQKCRTAPTPQEKQKKTPKKTKMKQEKNHKVEPQTTVSMESNETVKREPQNRKERQETVKTEPPDTVKTEIDDAVETILPDDTVKTEPVESVEVEMPETNERESKDIDELELQETHTVKIEPMDVVEVQMDESNKRKSQDGQETSKKESGDTEKMTETDSVKMEPLDVVEVQMEETNTRTSQDIIDLDSETATEIETQGTLRNQSPNKINNKLPKTVQKESQDVIEVVAEDEVGIKTQDIVTVDSPDVIEIDADDDIDEQNRDAVIMDSQETVIIEHQDIIDLDEYVSSQSKVNKKHLNKTAAIESKRTVSQRPQGSQETIKRELLEEANRS